MTYFKLRHHVTKCKIHWFFNETGWKYLKYSMGPGRGGIHISRVLCSVSIARIQGFKNVLCRFRLYRKKKKEEKYIT